MGLYDAYRNDAQAEVDGIWIKFDGGFRLRIARAGGANKGYAKALAEEAQAMGEKGGSFDDGALRRLYVRSIIKEADGAGFVTDKGTSIQVGSPELERALEDLPDFFNEIVERATDRRNFLTTATDPAKR